MARVESMKSELDLFLLPPIQTNVEQGKTVSYKPLASLQGDSPIEFNVPGAGDEYIDLAHSMIQVKVKIMKGDAAIAAADNVGPVNNFLHSLFSQIEVYVNQKQVTPAANSYPYRAYIETLLNYSQNAKQSHLTTALWYKDTPHKMDNLIENTGFTSRKQWTNLSNEIELYGGLYCDLFNINKYLMNGIELKLKFVRSKSSFCLMAETDEYRVVITDMTLFIRKVKILPKIMLAHEAALAHGNARYPFTRVETKILTVPANIQNTTLDNIFLGPLPKRVIIGFLTNRAFNGDITLNPYHFNHFHLNYMSLFLDSEQIPGKPLQPNFERRMYTMAYYTLFTGTGIHYLDDGNDISLNDYPGGYTLYAFDLTPDQSANDGSHFNPVKVGNLRMEIGFARVLTETVNCLVYAEFDSLLQIDKHRNTVLDYGS